MTAEGTARGSADQDSGWVNGRASLRLGLAGALVATVIGILAIPGAALVAVFLVATPPGRLLTGLLLGGLALSSLVAIVFALARRRWRALATEILAPIVIVVLFVPWDGFAVVARIACLVQLPFLAGELHRQAAAMPSGTGPHVVTLTTDGFLDLSSGLAWDEQDALARPQEERATAWGDRWGGSAPESRCVQTVRLVGHYYAWSGVSSCE